MFWAIYNETNENSSIDRPDITADPGDSRFEFLGDHRYLMARTMLDNIPLNDFVLGVAYMNSWGGSIANPTYGLWTIQGVDPNIDKDTEESGEERCRNDDGNLIGFYKDKSTPVDTLSWFNEYSACFLVDGELAGVITGFDDRYSAIMDQITNAINHHLSGVQNPVAGARFIKTTSKCYVWHRDGSGRITSCRPPLTPATFASFCAEVPNRPGDPVTDLNRNCDPGSITSTTSQQLDLSTVVSAEYFPSFGLYTPDQPVQTSPSVWTSQLGCENRCNFIVDDGRIDSY